jgi:glyoxylase-like metal-dependent hydrolase (beta-lactamase superfamily II)
MIPFRSEFRFEYALSETLSPLIRRVVARNPGPFTYTGTGTYIIGHGTVAVIDPGPDNREHLDALITALKGETVSHILVTHHHLDHSPLARPLADHFGAKIYSLPGVMADSDGGAVRLDAGDDLSFQPDVEIADGWQATGPGWTLGALHTPGHTSSHLCFALAEEETLFCGDHVMAWSTSIVTPPDGHMGDYLASLRRIRDLNFQVLWPTHGPAIEEPRPFIDAYIAHRLHRMAQIERRLEQQPATIRELVSAIYADLETRLHPAAAHVMLAHLIHLCEDGRVCTDGTPDALSVYRLAGPRQRLSA